MVKIKRSVIQIANSTQLISLPRKWSKKYNIQKGDELDVEENGDTIVIRTEKDIASTKIEIDFNGKEKVIHHVLSSLYLAGYDELRIVYGNVSELEIIQSTINQELIGFEVVEEGKEYIIVKQVSSIDPSEFQSILRRIFVFLLNTSDETLEAFKSNNTDSIKNLVLRDITINKLTDYCIRAINKKESYFKHLGAGYTIIELLEKISDDYRDLCTCVSKNEIKVSKSIIKTLFEINSLLRMAYKLFYNFNLNDMKNFLVKKEKVDELVSNLSKNLRKNEVLILLYLDGITTNTYYLSGPLIINGL